MKKFLFILASCLCFLGVSLADYLTTGMTITLNPGWNVVSTPTVLSDVSFSNGGDGISFMYLEGTEWKNTTITSSNVASVFKPLDGFLVKNNNSQDVQMTLSYDMNIDISGVMREKEVRAGWNFLGITKTLNPFQNIVSTSASIIVDFTKKFYNGASISNMKENPSEYEIGKAYGVFADKSGIYGGLTSFSNNINCSEPSIAALCSVDSVDCPKQCQTSYNEVTGIKLENTNLGNINVTQGAQSVTISEGTILVEKSVIIPSFNVTSTNTGIKSLVFIVNGVEYTATTTDHLTFTFENVQITKSGRVQFKANIEEDAQLNTVISLPTISHDTIQSARFSDNNELVGIDNIAGSIVFSNIYITVPKASLKNDLTKSAEFINGEYSEELVFSGNYTVKNGMININNYEIRGTDPSSNAKVTFYLSINGQDIDDIRINADRISNTFPNITINPEEPVKVSIKAEAELIGTAVPPVDLGTFQLRLGGEDMNGNAAGVAQASTTNIKIINKPTPTIGNDAPTKNTVLRRATGIEMAQFKVKPSDDSHNFDFDTITFTLTGSSDFASFDEYDIILDIDDQRQDLNILNRGSDYVTYITSPYIEVSPEGANVYITIQKNIIGKVSLIGLKLNNIPQPKTFHKYFVDTLVSFDSLDDAGAASYVYELDVDGNSNNLVSNFTIYTTTGNCVADLTDTSLIKTTPIDNVADGDTVSIKRRDAVQEVCGVTYEIANVASPNNQVSIDRVTYPDYFKIGGQFIDIPKA